LGPLRSPSQIPPYYHPDSDPQEPMVELLWIHRGSEPGWSASAAGAQRGGSGGQALAPLVRRRSRFRSSADAIARVRWAAVRVQPAGFCAASALEPACRGARSARLSWQDGELTELRQGDVQEGVAPKGRTGRKQPKGDPVVSRDDGVHRRREAVKPRGCVRASWRHKGWYAGCRDLSSTHTRCRHIRPG